MTNLLSFVQFCRIYACAKLYLLQFWRGADRKARQVQLECQMQKKLKLYLKLNVNNVAIKYEEAVKYLGDWFNSKGNNKDLIQDRIKKATGNLISIFATVDEVRFGAYQPGTSIICIIPSSMVQPQQS